MIRDRSDRTARTASHAACSGLVDAASEGVRDMLLSHECSAIVRPLSGELVGTGQSFFIIARKNVRSAIACMLQNMLGYRVG